MLEKARELLTHFCVQGEVVSAEAFGSGHINTTIRVCVDDNGAIREFVLQKININVFKNPRKLMQN